MKKPATPSEAQLEILDLLWQHAPLTVREVNDHLNRRRPVSYTTTLTQLQRMAEAGLVERNTSARTHTYKPLPTREAVEQQLFGRLARTAFGGSTFTLALRALGNQQPTDEELDALQAFIDRQKQ